MTACLLCPVYRRDRDPHPADPYRVCGGCWPRPGRDLAEIADLFRGLPAWLVPGATHGPKVSGSREAPVPVDLAVVDLMLPARANGVTDAKEPAVTIQPTTVRWARFQDGQHVVDEIPVSERRPVLDANGRPVMVGAKDQTGQPSVASVLDSWVRDWADLRGEHLPVPTVDRLAGWLTDRCDWALGSHPAVDEFADEIGALVRILRAANKLYRPQPTLCVGVPCQNCNWTWLWRQPDGEVWCDNPDCRRVYSAEDYQRWVVLLAENVKGKAA